MWACFLYQDSQLFKYGVNNYSKTKEYKDKVRNTLLKKYGSVSLYGNEEYRRDNFDMAKDENYIKYASDGESEYKCDCGKNHTFMINTTQYYNRKRSNIKLCTICYPIGDHRSLQEINLFEYIKSIYNGEIESNYRGKCGLEIDIYLPDINVGFEYNGLYWHSDKYRSNDYHHKKFNSFKDDGITIYTIWEDDWINDNNSVISQINAILKKDNIIDLNLTICQPISDTDINEFLSVNSSKILDNYSYNIGFFIDNKLSIICEYEINNNSLIVNNLHINNSYKLLNMNCLFEKLFNYFNMDRIIYISNNDWNIINDDSINCIGQLDPSFQYIVNNKRTVSMISNIKIYNSGYSVYEMMRN